MKDNNVKELLEGLNDDTPVSANLSTERDTLDRLFTSGQISEAEYDKRSAKLRILEDLELDVFEPKISNGWKILTKAQSEKLREILLDAITYKNDDYKATWILLGTFERLLEELEYISDNPQLGDEYIPVVSNRAFEFSDDKEEYLFGVLKYIPEEAFYKPARSCVGLTHKEVIDKVLAVNEALTIADESDDFRCIYSDDEWKVIKPANKEEWDDIVASYDMLPSLTAYYRHYFSPTEYVFINGADRYIASSRERAGTVLKVGDNGYESNEWIPTVDFITKFLHNKNLYSWFIKKFKNHRTYITAAEDIDYIKNNNYVYTYNGERLGYNNLSSEARGLVQKVIIPDGTTEIKPGAFRQFYKLKTVNIPDSVKKIDSFAFDSDRIEHIFIPKSVETIGHWAFALAYKAECDIYCEAESKPAQWEEGWLGYKPEDRNITVHWGVTREEYNRIYGNIDEDLEITDVSDDPVVTRIQAKLFADKIGDCKVVDNVIYQLMDDFEIWDNNDWREVERGIFAIYKFEPDGYITAYTSTSSTCSEVDKIGVEPLEYFTGGVIKLCNSPREFISYLNDEFGRGWFDDEEGVEEFLRQCPVINEDLDFYSDDSVKLKEAFEYLIIEHHTQCDIIERDGKLYVYNTNGRLLWYYIIDEVSQSIKEYSCTDSKERSDYDELMNGGIPDDDDFYLFDTYETPKDLHQLFVDWLNAGSRTFASSYDKATQILMEFGVINDEDELDEDLEIENELEFPGLKKAFEHLIKDFDNNCDIIERDGLLYVYNYVLNKALWIYKISDNNTIDEYEFRTSKSQDCYTELMNNETPSMMDYVYKEQYTSPAGIYGLFIDWLIASENLPDSASTIAQDILYDYVGWENDDLQIYEDLEIEDESDIDANILKYAAHPDLAQQLINKYKDSNNWAVTIIGLPPYSCRKLNLSYNEAYELFSVGANELEFLKLNNAELPGKASCLQLTKVDDEDIELIKESGATNIKYGGGWLTCVLSTMSDLTEDLEFDSTDFDSYTERLRKMITDVIKEGYDFVKVGADNTIYIGDNEKEIENVVTVSGYTITEYEVEFAKRAALAKLLKKNPDFKFEEIYDSWLIESEVRDTEDGYETFLWYIMNYKIVRAYGLDRFNFDDWSAAHHIMKEYGFEDMNEELEFDEVANSPNIPGFVRDILGTHSEATVRTYEFDNYFCPVIINSDPHRLYVVFKVDDDGTIHEYALRDDDPYGQTILAAQEIENKGRLDSCMQFLDNEVGKWSDFHGYTQFNAWFSQDSHSYETIFERNNIFPDDGVSESLNTSGKTILGEDIKF